MQRIERRVLVLEQSWTEPEPEPEPEDLQALTLWYAQQHNFAKAAELTGITETEAMAEWGNVTGYPALVQAIEEQQQECLAYCQAQNAKRPQQAKPPEEQLPEKLEHLPADLKFDKRRWGTTAQQRGKARRQQERIGPRWRTGQ